MIDRILRRLTVRWRIAGGFLILVLLLALSVPLIVTTQSFLLNRLQQVTDVETRADRLLLLASLRVASSRVNLIRYTQDYTPSTYEALDDVDLATQSLSEAQDLITSPNQQEEVTLVLNALSDYKTLISDVEAARQAGEDLDASRLQFQAFRFGNDIEQRIGLIVRSSEARVAAANEAINAEAQGRMLILVSGYAGVLVLALILGGLVARSITRPVAELQHGAEAFRSGYLDTAIPVTGKDELSLLAQTFNQLVTQLSELYRDLERRVAARTERLEIAANLSERLSAILDLEELLPEVVNRIKESFDYYHAHIYLLDEQRENLVMAEGTGEAGAEMKRKGHSILLNAPTSLVARAARTGEIVKVDNVREAVDWLPNPLLPNTYSEMAVPIILDERVVGVLDVQEDEIAGLDEGDANLLRSLANQIAVTIRNARIFETVEKALVEAQTTHEHYMERSWQKTAIAAQGGQYHYNRPDVAALDERILSEAEQLALAQDRPTLVTLNDNDFGSESIQEEPDKIHTVLHSPGLPGRPAPGNPKSIVSPITLQDKIIGTLQLHPTTHDQTWTEDDLAIVEAVVDQLAQSAENLRLFDETRERASRERTIREITDKLREAPNLDALLETAARELGQRLGVRHTVLELGIEAEVRSDDNRENRQGDNGEELA